MDIVLHNARSSDAILTSIAISSGYGKHVAALTLNQTTKQLKVGFRTSIFYHVSGQQDRPLL